MTISLSVLFFNAEWNWPSFWHSLPVRGWLLLSACSVPTRIPNWSMLCYPMLLLLVVPCAWANVWIGFDPGCFLMSRMVLSRWPRSARHSVPLVAYLYLPHRMGGLRLMCSGREWYSGSLMMPKVCRALRSVCSLWGPETADMGKIQQPPVHSVTAFLRDEES